MIRRITTTILADADIRDIATYIAIDNVHAAHQFGVELWVRFQAICESPEIGRPVPGFGDLRVVRVSTRFWRYLVFYHSRRSDALEIIRVLHGARDLPALLRDIP